MSVLHSGVLAASLMQYLAIVKIH